MFENSQLIPIPPLHCVQVVRRSGVVGNIGSEFWRLANFVERIYVYLILWRLTVGTGDRTRLRDGRRYSPTTNILFSLFLLFFVQIASPRIRNVIIYA